LRPRQFRGIFSEVTVTADALLNPDKEPQNWLINHRTCDGQRFSSLARINRDNVKNLKLVYVVRSAPRKFRRRQPVKRHVR
jgi:glucose dehydrogenase